MPVERVFGFKMIEGPLHLDPSGGTHAGFVDLNGNVRCRLTG